MVTVHPTSKPVAAQQATVAPSTALRIPINNVRVGDYTAQIKIGGQGAVANVILEAGSSTFAIAPDRYQIDQDTDVKVTCAPNTYWQTDFPAPGLARFQILNGMAQPQSILGVPLFNNYYTVFDRAQHPYGAVRFAPIAPPPVADVPTPQSARRLSTAD
jgi:hypothetical protein